MPSPNALAGYLCRYPLVAAVSYSSEVQQVIKIYDQIDVHETATKLNADRVPPLRACILHIF